MNRRSATNHTVYSVFQVHLIFSFQCQIILIRTPNIQIATEAINTTTISRWKRLPCKTNTDRAKMGVFHTKPSAHVTKTKRQHCRHMRNDCFVHRSFINTESCVKASAPSLDETSLKPTTPPGGRPKKEQEQAVSEDCAMVTKRESTRSSHQNQNCKREKTHTAKLGPRTTPTRGRHVRDPSRQRSMRGKKNRPVPQTRVLADNVLQPLTRLMADTVQTASYIKKTTFELCTKVQTDACFNIPLAAKQCQFVGMRHEARFSEVLRRKRRGIQCKCFCALSHGARSWALR